MPNDNHHGNLVTCDQCLKLKTYGGLKESYHKFCSLGKDKKISKKCHSNITLALFNEEDSVYVIEKCLIPELHILEEFVNHLFWTGIVSVFGRDKALMWPKKLKLISKNNHGYVFEAHSFQTII